MNTLRKKLRAFPFLLDLKYWSRDRKTAKFFGQFVGPRKLFFDIGANFGNKTRVFTLLGVKVVAVEPQEECLKFLHRRFRGRNVAIVPGVVGAEKKNAELLVCESHGCSTLSEEWTKGRFSNLDFSRRQETTMTTLEELIRTFGVPDFCKIDVEGYEEEVLKGLKTKIPALNFEFLLERMDAAEHCLAMLESLGYTSFAVASGEDDFLTVPFTTKDAVVNFIKKSANSDYWGDIYAK
jgi:FkbM family methyltransferase